MNPTTDDLKTCGGICPICHDSLQDATMLHCKHIFCEECVATWFDRERTCPMCRAQVSIRFIMIACKIKNKNL